MALDTTALLVHHLVHPAVRELSKMVTMGFANHAQVVNIKMVLEPQVARNAGADLNQTTSFPVTSVSLENSLTERGIVSTALKIPFLLILGHVSVPLVEVVTNPTVIMMPVCSVSLENFLMIQDCAKLAPLVLSPQYLGHICALLAGLVTRVELQELPVPHVL